MYHLVYDANDATGTDYLIINSKRNCHSGWRYTVQEAVQAFNNEEEEVFLLPEGFAMQDLDYPVVIETDDLAELQTIALIQGY